MCCKGDEQADPEYPQQRTKVSQMNPVGIEDLGAEKDREIAEQMGDDESDQ